MPNLTSQLWRIALGCPECGHPTPAAKTGALPIAVNLSDGRSYRDRKSRLSGWRILAASACLFGSMLLGYLVFMLVCELYFRPAALGGVHARRPFAVLMALVVVLIALGLRESRVLRLVVTGMIAGILSFVPPFSWGGSSPYSQGCLASSWGWSPWVPAGVATTQRRA